MARRNVLPPDLADLVPSWRVELKALNRSPSTERVYLTGVRRYLAWLAAHDRPPVLTRPLVTEWVADTMTAGASPASAATWLAGVRQYSKWLAREGELLTDPLVGMSSPKSDVPVTPVLSEDDLKRLIKACQGQRLKDRRDEAAIRLMVETGMRIGECCALDVADVDVVGMTAVIRRGKGGRGRTVPFGPATARTLDRYLRIRKHHHAADTAGLWLGEYRTGRISSHGMRDALEARADDAGLAGFHPHVLRHTFASRWMSARGSEGGLMQVAGWRDRAMLDRYAAITANTRAHDEARKLNLGDY